MHIAISLINFLVVFNEYIETKHMLSEWFGLRLLCGKLRLAGENIGALHRLLICQNNDLLFLMAAKNYFQLLFRMLNNQEFSGIRVRQWTINEYSSQELYQINPFVG